jgi:hypothetical protein
MTDFLSVAWVDITAFIANAMPWRRPILRSSAKTAINHALGKTREGRRHTARATDQVF